MPFTFGFNAFDDKGNPIDNYKHAFSGALMNKTPFDEAQKGVKTLFDSAQSVPFTMRSPNMTMRQAAFSQQYGQWEQLRSALQHGNQAKLLAYDLETLAANTSPYAFSPITSNIAITELGVTSALLDNGSLKNISSNSIAGGINSQQLTSYLEMINKGANEQLTSRSQSSMMESLLDRLSRYSGNITDRYTMGTVRWQRDLLLVNNLAESTPHNLKSVHEGLMNLAIAGGVSKEEYLKAYSNIKGDVLGGFNTSAFESASQSFAESGLKPQILSKDSAVASKISKIFGAIDNDTIGITYNGDSFDNPIISKVLGITPNRRRSLDVYTAILNKAQNTQYNTKLEDLSKMLGISLDAHYAASDTLASMKAAITPELFDLGQNTKSFDRNIIGKTVYSKKNIAFDPSTDWIEGGTRFNKSVIEDKRLYSIDEVRELADGNFAVGFTSIGDNKKVVKQFSSAEEVENALRKSFDFLMEDSKLTEQGVIDTAKRLDVVKDADRARRNFEDMFSIRSIEAFQDQSTKQITFSGGFAQLKSSYDAYKRVAEQIAKTSPDGITEGIIKSVAETTEYDDVISKILLDFGTTFGYENQVYSSALRNFKASFGRFHDDDYALGRIIEEVDSHSDWDIYKKTMASGQSYNYIKDLLDNTNRHLSYVPGGQNLQDSVRTIEDMFTVSIIDPSSKTRAINGVSPIFRTAKDSAVLSELPSIRLNFSDVETTSSSIFSALRRAGDTKIQKVEMLADIAEDLSSRGFLDRDIVQSFERQVFNLDDTFKPNGVKLLESEINLGKYVQTISEGIDKKFTQVVKNTGFGIEDFLSNDASKLAGTGFEDVIFSNSIATDVLSKIRGDRYNGAGLNLSVEASGGNSIFTLGDVFKHFDQEGLLGELFEDTARRIKDISTTISSDSDLIKTLTTKMGYEEAAAEEMSRLIYANKGLATARKTGTNKAQFITTFAYDEGEKSAFILLNKNGDLSGLSQTSRILAGDMSNEISLAQKIEAIKQQGTSAVIPIPFVDKQEIRTGEALDDLFLYEDGVKKAKPFKTISVGEKGFKKIGQFKVGQYLSEESGSGFRKPFEGSNIGINNIDLSITDNTTEFMESLRKVRSSFSSIAEDATLSNAEAYERITKKANRAINNILTDMPGPSGFQAWKSGDTWRRTLIPNVADIAQSSQINIAPLQGLALRYAEQTGGNTYQIFKELIGARDSNQYSKITDRIIRTGEAPSEFKEYFLKHLSSVPMSDDGRGINQSILQWLKEGADSGQYGFTEGTRKTLDFLTSNNISQIVKEKATGEMKVALLDLTALNRYGMLDAMQRPTNTQQGTALSYKVSDAMSQLGEDNINKLDITFGYDAMSDVRDALVKERTRMLREQGISDVINDTITANVKQMHTLDINARYRALQDVLDEKFTETLTKFDGLSASQKHDIIEEAFNIMQSTSSSTYESRMILRPAFGEMDYFTAPAIKKASITPFTEAQIENITNFDITKNAIKSGQEFIDKKGRKIATYTGPSGELNGTVEDLLRSGEGFITEDVQGIRSAKIYLGNEKGMAYVPEFDSSPIYAKFKQIVGDRKDAKAIWNEVSNSIFDEVFGSNISIVADLEVNKHLSGSAIYGGILDTIFYEAKKTGQEQSVVDLFNATETGMKVHFADGRFIYDVSKMNKTGVYTQIDEVLAAMQGDNRYKSIIDAIERQKREGYTRTNISVGINNESMGEEMFLDPRSKTAFGSQGKQVELEEYVKGTSSKATKVLDGEKPNLDFNTIKTGNKELYYQDYILDYIEDESKKAFGSKHGFEKTIEGLIMATDAKQARNQLMLDIKLSDINLVDSGTNIEEALKTGVIKVVDNKGNARYSQTLENLAKQQGKNLDDIAALRITDLDEGFIMPLYATNIVDEGVQYSQSYSQTQRYIDAVKNYGKNKGYIKDQQLINELKEETLASYSKDLDFREKTSYLYRNLQRTKMRNSGMFSADYSYVPEIEGITNNMDLFLSKTAEGANYRASLVNSVLEGTGEGIKYTSLTNKLLSITQNDTTKYLDVVEFSREGLERLGMNFSLTGYNLLYAPENYKHIVDGLDNSFLEQLRNAEYLANKLSKFGVKDSIDVVNDKTIRALAERLSKTKQGKEVLSDIASDYLEQIGTFGITLRHPTFHEGSISTTLVRLNRTLGRDQMSYSAPLMKKLHLDFDADATMAKVFLDKKGAVLGQNNTEIFSALSKSYNAAIQNNNIHMAKLVRDISDKVDKSVGYVAEDGVRRALFTDLTTDSLDFRASMLEKSITESERMALYGDTAQDTILEVENFINKRMPMSEQGQEAFNILFKNFDIQYGNMRQNESVIRGAIKAKSIKEEIGVISNANFKINQIINQVSDKAFETGDKSLSREITNIKKLLHMEDIGFLPETEQGFISVKHAYESLNITQVSDYSRGMNLIFDGGDSEEGVRLLRNALSGKKITNLDESLDALTRLSKISGSSAIWQGLNKNIEYKESLDILQGLDTTTSKELREIYDNILGIQRNGYTTINGAEEIFNELKLGDYYVSASDGKPILYQYLSDNKEGLLFKKHALTKSGLKDIGEETISGSGTEINATLQDLFSKFGKGGYSDVQLANQEIRAAITNRAVGLKQLDLFQGSQEYNKLLNRISYLNQNKGILEYGVKFDPNEVLTKINNNIIERGSKENAGSIVDSVLSGYIVGGDLSKIDHIGSIRNLPEDLFEGFEGLKDITGIEKEINSITEGVATKAGNAYIRQASEENSNLFTKAMSKIMAFDQNSYLTDTDISKMFGYETISGESRVALNGRLFGRKFSTLTQDDIDNVLSYSLSKNASRIDTEMAKSTKEALNQYIKNADIPVASGLDNAIPNEILTSINEEIKARGSEAADKLGEFGEAFGQEKEKILNSASDLFAKGKQFIMEHKKGSAIAGAVLGIGMLGNMLGGSSNNSPLVGETETKPVKGVINNDKEDVSLAPKSIKPPITKQRPVYVNGSSGAQFRMSAKSRNILDKQDVARQLMNVNGQATDVTITDDRSRISNNWLERKFADLV